MKKEENYGQKIKKIELKINSYVDNFLIGKYKTKVLGNGLEIINVREYKIGDNLKNIDRKTTAKKNKKHTKEYMEERNINFILYIDNSIFLKDFLLKEKKSNLIKRILDNILNKNITKDFSKYGLVEKIIIFLGLLANKDKNSFGAIFPSKNSFKIIKKKIGKKNIVKIIESYKKAPLGKHFLKGLKKILNLGIKNDVIFIITDILEYDKWKQNEKFIKTLANKNKVFIINPLFDFEKDIENIKNKKIDGLDFPIDFIDKNIKKTFQKNKENLKIFFRQNKCKNIEITSEDSIVEDFFKFFNQK